MMYIEDDFLNNSLDNSRNGSKNSTVDTQDFEALLQDPFDQNEPQHNQQPGIAELEMLSVRQVSNEKLLDRLPEHRQKQAQDLAAQIDENNLDAIITYGAKTQQKLSEFSRSILENIQLKDTGDIGDVLVDLMEKLQSNDPKSLTAKPTLLQRVFGKVRTSLTETTLRYQQIGSQIDRVAIRLDREKTELLNDNQMLEQYYQKNREYFEALNVYIAAGEVKMESLQQEIIPNAIQQAKSTKNQMDVQKVNDLNQFLDRLDKRTHDLRLTRQMTIQQAPQIRMIQNTNQILAEKIQSSIHTAIPMWENQITIALALLRQQNAAVSQQIVTQTTNDLMLKNSEMLKQSSLDIAHESERGIIDIETLRQTQTNLITTIQETLDIQQAGRQQRQLAENELLAMEEELRDKLLEISHKQKQQSVGNYTADAQDSVPTDI